MTEAWRFTLSSVGLHGIFHARQGVMPSGGRPLELAVVPYTVSRIAAVLHMYVVK